MINVTWKMIKEMKKQNQTDIVLLIVLDRAE